MGWVFGAFRDSFGRRGGDVYLPAAASGQRRKQERRGGSQGGYSGREQAGSSVSYDDGYDDTCAYPGADVHGQRGRYYGADGDTVFWGDDDRGAYDAGCAGAVLLDTGT